MHICIMLTLFRCLPRNVVVTFIRSSCSTLCYTTLQSSRTHPISQGRFISDSSHRSDLFYHPVDPPTPVSQNVPAFALSFLSTPPPFSRSRTVIGWLPMSDGSLSDFKENRKYILNETYPCSNLFTSPPLLLPAAFRDVLHKAIQQGLQDKVDDIQINGALQLQQGWMHIHGRFFETIHVCFAFNEEVIATDDRNIPPLNRIGDPDDILASVLVKDSKVGFSLSFLDYAPPPPFFTTFNPHRNTDLARNVSTNASLPSLYQRWCDNAYTWSCAATAGAPT